MFTLEALIPQVLKSLGTLMLSSLRCDAVSQELLMIGAVRSQKTARSKLKRQGHAGMRLGHQLNDTNTAVHVTPLIHV